MSLLSLRSAKASLFAYSSAYRNSADELFGSKRKTRCFPQLNETCSVRFGFRQNSARAEGPMSNSPDVGTGTEKALVSRQHHRTDALVRRDLLKLGEKTSPYSLSKAVHRGGMRMATTAIPPSRRMEMEGLSVSSYGDAVRGGRFGCDELRPGHLPNARCAPRHRNRRGQNRWCRRRHGPESPSR
jgi:hypothetical protein